MGSAVVKESAVDIESAVVKGSAVDKGLTVSNNVLGYWPITVNHHGTSHLEQINIIINHLKVFPFYKHPQFPPPPDKIQRCL